MTAAEATARAITPTEQGRSRCTAFTVVSNPQGSIMNRTHTTTLVVAIGTLFLLGACSGMSRQEVSTATGAAVGAVAGAAVGGGPATTIGGAVIGGVVGHEVGKK
jgi:osmotically inducible lipoprotein OsmB